MSMKKATALCLALMLLCALPSLAQADDAAWEYAFADAAGDTITLSARPEKVAVLFSSFADIWVSAGGRVQITVGEAVERGFAGGDALLVDDGAGKTIDMERLIAAEPDFVIASADIAAQAEAARLLKEAGIPCALLRVESFDDYLDVLKIFTDITGRADAYETCGEEVRLRVAGILADAAAAQSGEPLRILFIRSGSSASSAKAKTADQHFAAKMLEELGAYNIADNAPVLLDGLSLEEILMEDPDCIFISTMGDEQAARAYMDDVLSQEGWQALSAVRNGQCAYLPKELFQFKPNASWAEAYDYLARMLYPETAENE